MPALTHPMPLRAPPPLRALLGALLILCAAQAMAACSGSDMRPRLTPSAEARLEAEIARTPYAYGNHWVASRDGRQIHVIGTMHTGDRRLGAVMRRLRPVIRSADAVLLEVTAHATDAELDQIMRDRSMFLLKEPPYLPDMLSEPVWDYLAARMAEDGFKPEQVARMQPWFAGFFLDQSGCSGGCPDRDWTIGSSGWRRGRGSRSGPWSRRVPGWRPWQVSRSATRRRSWNTT